MLTHHRWDKQKEVHAPPRTCCPSATYFLQQPTAPRTPSSNLLCFEEDKRGDAYEGKDWRGTNGLQRFTHAL